MARPKKKSTPVKEDAKRPRGRPSSSNNEQNVSSTVNASGANQYKTLSIILAVFNIVLIIAIIIVFSVQNNNNACSVNLPADNGQKQMVNESANAQQQVTASGNQANTTEEEVELSPEDLAEIHIVVVEDKDCESCMVDAFLSNLENNFFKNLTVEHIAFDSEEGKKVVAETESLTVPIYLFSKNIEERSDWTQISPSFSTDELSFGGEDYYMLDPSGLPSELIDEIKIPATAIQIGSEDAPVTVVTFTDYECPYCAIAEGNAELVAQFGADYVAPVPEVMKEYVDTGKVKYVFMNFPLESIHSNSRAAHNAALCAYEQDADKWREYSEKLFDDRDTWIDASDKEKVFTDYAEEFDLNVDNFKECYEEKRYDKQIDEEIALGIKYGVSGTPGFFVGKTFISGAQPFENFKEIIDAALNE